MSFLQLVIGTFQEIGLSEFVIRSELRKRGYLRFMVRGNSWLSEENRRIQKHWAEEHISWNQED